jgi:hypothetical protein
MPYEKKLIGKKIATGGDRKVYQYDTDKVIKFSSLSFFLGKRMLQKLERDYCLTKEYLSDFVVETVVVDSGKREHVEIQPYIKGEYFSETHAKQEDMKLQLREINTAIEKMNLDGYATLDLIGTDGLFRNEFSNIIVDKNNKLKIIDTTLLEGRSVGRIGKVADLIFPLVVKRQQSLMRRFLND